MSDDIRSLLEQVKNRQVDVDAALLKLKMKPIEEIIPTICSLVLPAP